MSKFKQCKVCSKEIASNAKCCPDCGAKNKKPFYKTVWFWIVAVIIIIGSIGGEDDSTTSNLDTQTKQEVSQNENIEEVSNVNKVEDVPTEYKSALRQAKIYSDTMNMSKAAIYDQLTSEYGGQFTNEAAHYAIDNVEANWKENALKSAETYQETMAMSPNAIYDQLVSEYGGQFTAEEAQYAIDNLE